MRTRTRLLALGSLTTLSTAFVATSHCCERINVLAAMGLVKAGCMGLSQYRGLFMAASLLSLAATLGYWLYGKRPEGSGSAGSAGPSSRIEWTPTVAFTLLATMTGLLLFVLP